jgi:hypothetical protein
MSVNCGWSGSTHEFLQNSINCSWQWHNAVVLAKPHYTLTRYLQPLDRTFFKPLKAYFRGACDVWIHHNPNKKIKGHHFGALLSSAWSHATTSEVAMSGFWASASFPLKWPAIPDHALLPSITHTSQDNDESGDVSASDLELPSSPETT